MTLFRLGFLWHCRVKLWLFLAYVVSFVSLAASVGLLVQDALTDNGPSAWTGAAGVLQCVFVLIRLTPTPSSLSCRKKRSWNTHRSLILCIFWFQWAHLLDLPFRVRTWEPVHGEASSALGRNEAFICCKWRGPCGHLRFSMWAVQDPHGCSCGSPVS